MSKIEISLINPNLLNELTLYKDDSEKMSRIIHYGLTMYKLDCEYNLNKDKISDKDEILRVLLNRMDNLERSLESKLNLNIITEKIENLNNNTTLREYLLTLITSLREKLFDESLNTQLKIKSDIDQLNENILSLPIKLNYSEMNKDYLTTLYEINHKVSDTNLRSILKNENIEVDKLLNSLSSLQTEILNMKASYSSEYNKIISYINDLKNDKILTLIREKLEELNNNLTKDIKPIKLLGDDGENFVESYIRSNLSGSSITRISGKNHVGDLLLEYKGLRIMLEIKNWNSDILKKEIDKFHKDLNNPIENYDGGILISLNSNIYRHNSFEYDIIDKKFCYYLSRVKEDKSSIITGINFVVNMIEAGRDHPYNKLINKNYISLTTKLIIILKESLKTDTKLLIELTNELEKNRRNAEYSYRENLKKIKERDTNRKNKISYLSE